MQIYVFDIVCVCTFISFAKLCGWTNGGVKCIFFLSTQQDSFVVHFYNFVSLSLIHNGTNSDLKYEVGGQNGLELFFLEWEYFCSKSWLNSMVKTLFGVWKFVMIIMSKNLSKNAHFGYNLNRFRAIFPLHKTPTKV